ncbi:hypothetical protein OG21DRAFT_1479682 [Imleria badia]|nr:hypothetical protein OG21DRAFT_1479682 [Imleria badia]
MNPLHPNTLYLASCLLTQTGHSCDSNGIFLPHRAPPNPLEPHREDNWALFHNRVHFELADFLYTCNQMPAQQIDMLLDIWAKSLLFFSQAGTMDDLDSDGLAPWMEDTYDIWYHCPHFMSGDWAWDQADKIARDHPACEGAAFVPIILGSDKTTMSIATDQHDYYPLYLSIGNIHNSAWCSHRNSVVLLDFSPIPRVTIRKGAKTACFCNDDYYQHVVYGLGPYIADYKEQVLLACIIRNWCARCLADQTDLDAGGQWRLQEHADFLIEELDLDTLWNKFGIVGDLVPFTNDFPCADIYHLLSPDILHQLIKGAFKDHLVDWVKKYLVIVYGRTQVDEILYGIDCCIAAVASFAGLQFFPQGRHFKQWTGNDSKALMKVYLPAIEGHFYYSVCKDIVTESDLVILQDALSCFHQFRKVFKTSGIVQTFSLPCQHSLFEFDMLLINQWLDKLAAARISFQTSCQDTLYIVTHFALLMAVSYRTTERHQAKNVQALGVELQIFYLPQLVQSFLHTRTMISHATHAHFTQAKYLDLCGVGGMRHEYICACPNWRNEGPCRDCIFVVTSPEVPGFRGMNVVRVLFFFFSFSFQGSLYPCVVIHWFDHVGDSPDKATGMWHVKPSVTAARQPVFVVIHVESIFRAAHLIPVYSAAAPLPSQGICPNNSYAQFCVFYVNKYADHHAFAMAF